jgi:hypothetical protein
MRLGGIGVLVGVVVLLAAGPASAAGLLSQTVSAASAVDTSCTGGERSGRESHRSASRCPRAARSRRA